MKKLVTTADVVVSSKMHDTLADVAVEQGKSISLVADEAINRALDKASGSLGHSLLELSQATQTAYHTAVANGRDDVAAELRVLAQSVAALVAKSLRADILPRVS